MLYQKENFYYLVEMSLVDLLDSVFINTYLKKGNFYALSHNSNVDTDSTFAIIPTGKLFLSLDKDTYEQFGLEGKLSSFPALKKRRKNITINLSAKDFIPGKKYYERVKWCLGRLSTVKFLCSWTLDSKISEIEFPQGAKVSKIPLEISQKVYTPLKIPKLEGCIDKIDDSQGELMENFYEWLGLISCGATSSIDYSASVSSFVSSFECPLDFNENIKTCISIKAKGFIIPSVISYMVSSLRQLMSSSTTSEIPWTCVHSWGFLDSPISWNENEHGYLLSGENDYTFVLLPSDNYWQYVALGTYDTFS